MTQPGQHSMATLPALYLAIDDSKTLKAYLKEITRVYPGHGVSLVSATKLADRFEKGVQSIVDALFLSSSNATLPKKKIPVASRRMLQEFCRVLGCMAYYSTSPRARRHLISPMRLVLPIGDQVKEVITIGPSGHPLNLAGRLDESWAYLRPRTEALALKRPFYAATDTRHHIQLMSIASMVTSSCFCETFDACPSLDDIHTALHGALLRDQTAAAIRVYVEETEKWIGTSHVVARSHIRSFIGEPLTRREEDDSRGTTILIQVRRNSAYCAAREKWDSTRIDKKTEKLASSFRVNAEMLSSASALACTSLSWSRSDSRFSGAWVDVVIRAQHGGGDTELCLSFDCLFALGRFFYEFVETIAVLGHLTNPDRATSKRRASVKATHTSLFPKSTSAPTLSTLQKALGERRKLWPNPSQREWNALWARVTGDLKKAHGSDEKANGQNSSGSIPLSVLLPLASQIYLEYWFCDTRPYLDLWAPSFYIREPTAEKRSTSTPGRISDKLKTRLVQLFHGTSVQVADPSIPATKS